MCTRLEAFTLYGGRLDVSTAGELAAVLGCDLGDLVTRSGDPVGAEYCLCDVDADDTAERFGWRVDYAPPVGADAALIQTAWGGGSIWRERLGRYGLASAQCHAEPGKVEFMAWAVYGDTTGENPLQERGGDCWFTFATTRDQALADLRRELLGVANVTTH